MIYLLHGNLGTSQDWNALQDWLPQGIATTISLWDLLDDDSSLENTGKKLLDICEKDSTIVGYSLGGRLAMHAFLANPKHWETAIFMSSHFGIRTERARQERLLRDQEWARLCLTLSRKEFMRRWNDQPVFLGSTDIIPPKDLDFEQVARAFDVWSLGRQKNLAPLLARCRDLWRSFVGEHDKKFRTLWERQFAAETNLIKGAGHRIIHP